MSQHDYLISQYKIECDRSNNRSDKTDFKTLCYSLSTGQNVQEAEHIIDQICSNQFEKNKHGIFKLPKPIISTFKLIDNESAETDVYTTNMFHHATDVICKQSRNNSRDLFRQYYIGKVAVNSLRGYVPNFVHTFNIFQNHKLYAFYEKIPGYTLRYLVQHNKISFSMFLNLFFQILLALELAQQQCRFGHYDLHNSNVIIRKVSKPFNYDVRIGTKKYRVTVRKYYPVIIDFGYSTVYHYKHIGTQDMTQHGIYPFLLPGIDVYKFLFYNLLFSAKLYEPIQDLFSFYDNDPYNIRSLSKRSLIPIAKEYVKRISTSPCVASSIPLDFIDWIWNQSKYRQHLYSISLSDCFSNTPVTTQAPDHNKIVIPHDNDLKHYLNLVLSSSLDSPNVDTKEFFSFINFYCKIINCVQHYFCTSTQTDFGSSHHFRLYREYGFLIERALRWAEAISQFESYRR